MTPRAFEKEYWNWGAVSVKELQLSGGDRIL